MNYDFRLFQKYFSNNKHLISFCFFTQVATLEDKHVKLVEKRKQDEVTVVATAAVAAATQPPPKPIAASVAAVNVMPTTAISTAISTPAPVTTTSSSGKIHNGGITEHILKEIQVTLEERKKLQNYVSKYEKGLQDLERDSSPLHNVSDLRTENKISLVILS